MPLSFTIVACNGNSVFHLEAATALKPINHGTRQFSLLLCLALLSTWQLALQWMDRVTQSNGCTAYHFSQPAQSTATVKLNYTTDWAIYPQFTIDCYARATAAMIILRLTWGVSVEYEQVGE